MNHDSSKMLRQEYLFHAGRNVSIYAQIFSALVFTGISFMVAGARILASTCASDSTFLC